MTGARRRYIFSASVSAAASDSFDAKVNEGKSAASNFAN